MRTRTPSRGRNTTDSVTVKVKRSVDDGDVRCTGAGDEVPASPVTATDNDTTTATAGDVVHLSECGTLGKQTLTINATAHITMTFHAARSAIGQRGFIVRVEGTACSYWLWHPIDEDVFTRATLC